ncbi:MAG: response regulator [Planctomycetes bacterium]|nr:response regulator [Planctomycetota bacterium]
MATPLSVLLVEDSEDDAELELIELRRAGFLTSHVRVDTREEMAAALAEGAFDIVLCDHAMPSFNSSGALGLLRERGLDTPVIIVSGMMGEDVAVEALKTGAADYVLKGNLRRLGPAVARALREAEERRRLRETERGLRDNLARQKAILDALPLALYAARPDAGFRTTWITENVERISGFSASRFLEGGDLLLGRVHGEDAPGVRRALEGLAPGGTAVLEYRWRTADGRWRWFIDHVTLAPGAGCEGAGVLGVWVDITDRKQLELQLRQSQKTEAIGRLAGGVAHDFNNILTVILGYADLIRESAAPGSPVIPQVEEIRKAGLQASSLTRQLLAFSRRQVLEFRILDLNQTVAGMERMIRRLLGEDLRLEVATTPGIGMVRADAGQLELVLLNLVVNAKDAVPPGGRIRIGTANARVGEGEGDGRGGILRPGEFVALSVSDDGHGMDEETRGRVFEPFFTTKPEGKGTGLGLATVHGIVQQSGGQIHLETAPGRGTTFRVLLPAAAGEPSPAADPPRPPAGAAVLPVLVVEDEPSIRRILLETLSQAGYRVEAVSSAEAALERLRGAGPAPFSLVLTDLIMQGMTGIELARRVRALHPGLPILGMTGYIDRDSFGPALEACFSGFLRKPFPSEELLRRVAEATGAA